MQVYLSENVFMGLVLSAVEVYKKECFGLLLGYRTPGKYIVEHAIPYQSVRRGHNWTELRSDKWKIMKEILANFPKLDAIGDFHSHTMYRDIKASIALSPDDIQYMEPHELQIVIAINENRRSKEWSVNFDHTISGSIDQFHFKIAAYFYENGERNNGKRPRLAQILCPYAMGTPIGSVES
jgi:proteasome lid subunit RPN8/RPN11